MKLQRVFSYKYLDTPRYKYLISIPEKIIKEMGWEPGSKLQIKKKGKNLVIHFKSNPSTAARDSAPSMSFDVFQEKIGNLLKIKPDLTWRQIRQILSLPQVVPNNKWVVRMEQEIGLVRLKNKHGIVWKLKGT